MAGAGRVRTKGLIILAARQFEHGPWPTMPTITVPPKFTLPNNPTNPPSVGKPPGAGNLPGGCSSTYFIYPVNEIKQ